MRDPLLIVEPIPEDQYYKKQNTPPFGWQQRNAPTIEQMNVAHANIRKLVTEKDRIIEQSNGVVEVLKRERQWRKWMIAAFGATWSIIILLLKILVPYAIKGMLLR
jgi:hypothetical protein